MVCVAASAAIYLERPSILVQVRSWTPCETHYNGFLITHDESIGIAEYYTVCQDGDNDFTLPPLYRPTVHYAYHPCDDAVTSIHELAGKNFVQQPKQRLIKDEVVSGEWPMNAYRVRAHVHMCL
jgi:homospermidine synthase